MKVKIPVKQLLLCQKVAKLARDAELHKCELIFRPNLFDKMHDEIRMYWEQGRHGEDSGSMTIFCKASMQKTFHVDGIEDEVKEGDAGDS